MVAHKTILALLACLVTVMAQEYTLQPGQVFPISFTVPENATITDQRISVAAGPGQDVTIRCTPASVTNGTWYWESALPSGAVERIFITSADPAFADDPNTAGDVNCELINSSQPPRSATVTVSQAWRPKPALAADDANALEKIYASCCGKDGVLCPQWSSDWCGAPGQVCDINGHIVQLSFAGFNMSCDFPYISIAALPNLRTFISGEGNAFTGEWEETLSAFSNRPMETLIFVNSAGIKGSLTPEEGVPPACSLAQKSLKVLDLYNNTIQGSIPDCILNGTSKLQYIRLGFNQLSGSIPDVFAPNTPLAWFTAPSNQLTGSIPSTIGNLSNIFMLNLTSNALSGSLPESIGNAPYLMHVIARNNNITGAIPQSLATNPTLITIDMRNNRVTGLPTEWYQPPDNFGTQKLQAVRLGNNSIAGPIPMGLAMLSSLLELNLAVNAFNGTLPVNPNGGTFPNMLLFNVSSNSITGPIPDQYSQMRMWGMTSSSVNTATGLMPWQMIFDIANNNLDGNIPAFLSNDTLNSAIYNWTTVNLTNAGSFPNGCEPAFSQVPGACNTTDNVCGAVETGVAYKGTQLAVYSKQSRSSCCAMCMGDAACEFWVLRVDGSGEEGCYLMSDRGSLIAEGVGYTTGIIPGRTAESAASIESAYTDPSGATTMTTQQSSGGGLSAGAIVGIVIAVLAGVAVIAVLGFFMVRRMRRRSVTSISAGQVKSAVGSTPAHKFERFEDEAAPAAEATGRPADV